MQPGILVPPAEVAEVAEPRWPARLVRLLVGVLGLRVILELAWPAFYIGVWWGFFEWNSPAPSVARQFATPLVLFGFRSAVKRGHLPAAALLMAVEIWNLWIFRKLAYLIWTQPYGWDFWDVTIVVFPPIFLAVDALGLWGLWRTRSPNSSDEVFAP